MTTPKTPRTLPATYPSTRQGDVTTNFNVRATLPYLGAHNVITMLTGMVEIVDMTGGQGADLVRQCANAMLAEGYGPERLLEQSRECEAWLLAAQAEAALHTDNRLILSSMAGEMQRRTDRAQVLRLLAAAMY